MHEVQRRTDKVQCQRCYSYVEAGFHACPCGGKLNMSEERLSCIQLKIKELIANAYMTFQKRRGAKHGAQLWQKHHFEAKEFLRKIMQKGEYKSILDRFQNDDVFHARQRQHNWTEAWSKKLDYVRTIDITHRSPPEQRERYAALYHFRYHPKYMERGLLKSRPEYHETSRTIVSMNRGAVRIHKSHQKGINAAMIWTQRSSNGLHGFPITGNGISRSTDTQKFWAPHSCPIKN